MTSAKAWIGLAGVAVAAMAAASAGAAPQVDHSATTQALESLPRKAANQRPIVTIYQFRGGVPGVNAGAATDMFMTALMKSGAFLVAERVEANDVMAEKRLNMQGMTDGDTATKKLAGAKYIFDFQHTHNDGVDAALRACIEDAVLELVKRHG